MAEPKPNRSERFLSAEQRYQSPRRRQFAANTNSGPNYTPQYPTVAGNFNDENYGPRGIRNITTEGYTDQSRTEPRSVLVRSRRQSSETYRSEEASETESQPKNERVRQIIQPDTTEPVAVGRSLKNSVPGTLVKKTASLFSTAIVTGVLIPVTSFLWGLGIFWISLFFGITLSLLVLIQSSTGTTFLLGFMGITPEILLGAVGFFFIAQLFFVFVNYLLTVFILYFTAGERAFSGVNGLVMIFTLGLNLLPFVPMLFHWQLLWLISINLSKVGAVAKALARG